MEKVLMSEYRLTIEIQNKEPVELVDYTSSLFALSQEYNKFLNDTDGFKITPNTKLFIKEIKQGSIITVLTDLLPATIAFIEHPNSILEFTKFLNKATNWLLGKTNEKPKLDNTDLKNISTILNPIAKDNGAQVNFSGSTIENVNLIFNLNSVEANAIQNTITRELANSKVPDSNIHEKVLFYWESAKYGSESKSIDRGFIDALYPKALKVVFEKEDYKTKMIDTQINPYHLIFIVDVEVQTVQDIPTIYKIVNFHEAINKE